MHFLHFSVSIWDLPSTTEIAPNLQVDWQGLATQPWHRSVTWIWLVTQPLHAFCNTVKFLSLISVLSNVNPTLACKITNSFFERETEKACDYQLEALPLIESLFADVNPIPVKEALNIIGFNFGIPRLPLVKCSDDLQKKLKQQLNT